MYISELGWFITECDDGLKIDNNGPFVSREDAIEEIQISAGSDEISFNYKLSYGWCIAGIMVYPDPPEMEIGTIEWLNLMPELERTEAIRLCLSKTRVFIEEDDTLIGGWCVLFDETDFSCGVWGSKEDAQKIADLWNKGISE